MEYLNIKNNKIRNLVLLVSALVYISSFFFDTRKLGFSFGSTWQRATYMFASFGVLHYLINAVSFYFLYNLSESTIGFKSLVVFFIIGVLATFGAELDVPTVGMSGVVFGMFGFLFYFSPTYLRNAFALVVGQSLLSFHLGLNLNLIIHANAFFYGLLFAIIYKYKLSWNQSTKRKF